MFPCFFLKSYARTAINVCSEGGDEIAVGKVDAQPIGQIKKTRGIIVVTCPASPSGTHQNMVDFFDFDFLVEETAIAHSEGESKITLD